MSSKGPLRTAQGRDSAFDCSCRVCSAEQFQSMLCCPVYCVTECVFGVPWVRYLCLFPSGALPQAVISRFSNTHTSRHDANIICSLLSLYICSHYNFLEYFTGRFSLPVSITNYNSSSWGRTFKVITGSRWYLSPQKN